MSEKESMSQPNITADIKKEKKKKKKKKRKEEERTIEKKTKISLHRA